MKFLVLLFLLPPAGSAELERLAESQELALGSCTAGSDSLPFKQHGCSVPCWGWQARFGGCELLFLPPCEALARVLLWAGIQPSPLCLSHRQLEAAQSSEVEVGWLF